MSSLPNQDALPLTRPTTWLGRIASVLSARQPLIAQSHAGILCCVSTLLSAFLVFQVQPIVGKSMLPLFGGGHSVWTVCLVFFQFALLVGYLYAHVLAKFLTPSQQAATHVLLVLLAFLFLPLSPTAGWLGSAAEPGFVLTFLLASNVAAPYVLLAATSPLLQSWYAAIYPGKIPYRLYALSNLGSLVALLSYPLIVEPTLGVTTQRQIWSVGFVLFAVCTGALAIGLRGWTKGFELEATTNDSPRANPVGLMTRVRWIALAAFGSMALVATSNHISVETAVTPLLWLAPLSLYLVTFIIAFERPNWYAPRWWGLACVLSMLAFMLHLCDTWTPQDDVLAWFGLDDGILKGSLLYRVTVSIGSMFFLCQLCHGELHRRRPANEHLTSFYLHLAAGGAMGGLFVSLFCPILFNSFYETKLMIGFAIGLALWLLMRDGERHWKIPGTAVGVIVGVLGMFAVGLAYNEVSNADHGPLYQQRNFHGVARVTQFSDETGSGNGLHHGGTLHGFQYHADDKSKEPTIYYSRDSGVGLAFNALSDRENLRVGAVGLGVGTVAAYGRKGDQFHFFEIDRLIVGIADFAFSYLKDTAAETEITIGDARITLEKQPDNAFDLLVLDAFNGDSVPTHLLTREAFEEYRRVVDSDGVIALHISNRVLNLLPVVAAGADYLQMPMVYMESKESTSLGSASAKWVLMSNDKSILDDSGVQRAIESHEKLSTPRVIWTDERNSLLSVIE